MMRDIEHAAIDMAADMVMLFHVNKYKEWSPDFIAEIDEKYSLFDFDELYLMAQVLFPVMLVRFVAGLPLMENDYE